MEITDVQVKLIGNGDDRLKASCTIAIDGEFVIRDVKVIEGTNGLFVAMPSRKLTDHCTHCGHKNHLRSTFCNHCGKRLNNSRWTQKGGAAQLHAEIAHPINRECRERLHKRVIEAYEALLGEQAHSGGPGDRSTLEPGDPAADMVCALDDSAIDDLDFAWEDDGDVRRADARRNRATAESEGDRNVSSEPQGDADNEFGSGIL